MSRLGLVLLLALASPSCRQGEGEACQVNEDCRPGLVCQKSAEMRALDHGTCEKTSAPSDAASADRAEARAPDSPPPEAPAESEASPADDASAD